MTLAAVLTVVRCAFTDCPKVRMGGSPQVIGRVEVGAAWELKCPRCRRLSSGRA